jgi:heme A synthase
MDAALHIAMRWLHIASVIVLLGGVFYGRLVNGLDLRFRPVAYMAIGGILVSGLYNFLSKTDYPEHYHMWFGIKVLLALDVLAAVALYKSGKERSLTRVVIFGAVIVAISGYLRWISQ